MPTDTGSTPDVGRKKVIEAANLWDYNFGLQDHKIPLPHGLEEGVSPPETFDITEVSRAIETRRLLAHSRSNPSSLHKLGCLSSTLFSPFTLNLTKPNLHIPPNKPTSGAGANKNTRRGRSSVDSRSTRF